MLVFNLSIAAVVFVLFSGWSRVIFWLPSLSLCHPADVLAPESCSLKCYQPCVTYSRIAAGSKQRTKYGLVIKDPYFCHCVGELPNLDSLSPANDSSQHACRISPRRFIV